MLDARASDDAVTAQAQILETSAESLEAWSQEVVPRLSQRLKAELDKSKKNSQPNVESGRLGDIIGRWNALGISAALSMRFNDADLLFKALLSLLRREQNRLGRLHKGTPLHELGWIRLRAGDVGGATPYILAALLEDAIRDPESFVNGPAAKVSLNVLGRDRSLFRDVKGFVATKHLPKELTEIAFLDPELLSLVRSMNTTGGGELLRISLHYDRAIDELLETASA